MALFSLEVARVSKQVCVCVCNFKFVMFELTWERQMSHPLTGLHYNDNNSTMTQISRFARPPLAVHAA